MSYVTQDLTMYLRPVEHVRPYIIAGAAQIISREGMIENGRVVYPSKRSAYNWLLSIQTTKPSLFRYHIGRFYQQADNKEKIIIYRRNINQYQSAREPYGNDPHMYYHKKGLY